MAYAYTPGLTVTENGTVVRRRILPLRGKVVVNKGDRVEPDTVVAETFLPGNVHMANLSHKLAISPQDVKNCMRKAEGDPVEKDEVLAEKISFFGLLKTAFPSPVTGTLEAVSPVSGQIILREPPIPVSVTAYIRGVVKTVFPEEGVAVETSGTYIQGIFGVCGETWGPIRVIASSPREVLPPERITEDHKGQVLVGGSCAPYEVIRRAAEAGAKALILGGVDDTELKKFMGYDLGIAITGSENLGLSLIITEGFGKIDMAERTFSLLKKNEGKSASVNGATQIRAGVLRPEIIVPDTAAGEAEKKGKTASLEIGSQVRIIRGPHFGKICTVTDLPAQPAKMETEAVVRIVQVKLPEGEALSLPRANVELLEE